LFLLLPLLALLACSDADTSSSEGDVYKELAVQFCQCATPSVELNRKMKKLLEDDQRDQFVQMSSKAQETFQQTIRCFQQNTIQVDPSSIDVQELEKSLRVHCKEIPSRMMQDFLLKLEK
ncbi:MAG: hypothetical protein AAFV25_01755, partial [Bacteroidota bacterium]